MNLLVPGIAGWLGRCNDQHAKTQCKYCEIPFCLLDKFFFKESTVNHRSDQQYKEITIQINVCFIGQRYFWQFCILILLHGHLQIGDFFVDAG